MKRTNLDWSDYIEIIDRELEAWEEPVALTIQRVEREQHVPGAGILFITEEPTYRKVTDLAAKKWASTGLWPLSEPLIADYLKVRLNFASKFLHKAKAIRPACSGPKKRVLRWLLVDYWRFVGRASWVQHCFGDKWPG